MKKYLSILFICLFAANFMFAQQEVQVQASQPDALFNAVSNAVEGDVLILSSGGIYPISAALPISVPITIKTADGAESKARVVAIADATGEYPFYIFSVDASLTVKNIIFNGQKGTEEAAGGMWATRGTLAPGSKFHVDGCEISKFYSVSQGGACDTLIVENTLLNGNIVRAGGWGGTFDFQGDIIKYVRIQNNTVMFCIFGPYLGTGWGNYSSSEKLTNEVIIDHNTVYNISGAHGPTTMFNRTKDVTLTNNLYINGTFRPNEFFSDKYVDFPNNADDITDYTNVLSVLGPKGMWLMDIAMIDSAETVIDMQSNNISWTNEVTDYWTSKGLDKPYLMTNNMATGIDPAKLANASFEEELTFVDAPATPMFAVEAIADYCALGNAAIAAGDSSYIGETPYQGWDWYVDLVPQYDYRESADIDMAYNTDAVSYTAGIDGFPLGDLNWFPEMKALWESGGVVGVEELQEVPTRFELSQNYPNPFNPATTIKFSLPNSGLVTLKVFNMLGQEVAELINEDMSQGSYNFDFDASELTSGVYVYQITAGSFISAKKMILLK